MPSSLPSSARDPTACAAASRAFAARSFCEASMAAEGKYCLPHLSSDTVSAPQAKLTIMRTMTLGARIRSARQKAGLSQQALAGRIGSLSRNAISLWESNDTKPSQAHLLKLPQILGVSLSWLTGSDDDQSITMVPMLTWVSAGDVAADLQISNFDEVGRVAVTDLPDGDWIALTVEGDSMNRISPPGSIIVANRKQRQLVPNACYVVANEQGEATYKRYRPNPDRFEPVSTNPDHEAHFFDDHAVRIIGRVRRSWIDM